MYGRMARYPRDNYIWTWLGKRAASSGRFNLYLSGFARCRYSHGPGNGGTDGRHSQAMLLRVRDHRGWSCGDGGASLLRGVQIGRGTETRPNPCPFRLGPAKPAGTGRALIGT